MKRLVVCCDGTWNTPEQESGGQLAPTNVVRLHNAVDAKGADGVVQEKYYHAGRRHRGFALDADRGWAVG